MTTTIKPTSIRLDSTLLREVEKTAKTLHRSKTWLIQEAVKYYIQECADLEMALEKYQNPNTQYLDWEKEKDGLLNQD